MPRLVFERRQPQKKAAECSTRPQHHVHAGNTYFDLLEQQMILKKWEV